MLEKIDIKERYRMKLMGPVRSILLATDGSDYSRGAVKEAIAFSRECNTSLRLLRVLEINPAYESMGFSYSTEMVKLVEEELDTIREDAALNNVECTTMLKRSERVHEAITEEAEKQRTDIIIMGRRGMTGLKKFIMGSVTAKVIASTSSKVLVVPKEAQLKGETLLVASDGSKHSEGAVNEAIDMASRCPVVKSLLAVSVVPDKSKLGQARDILSKISDRANARGVKVETFPLVGQPYKTLVNASLEMAADIIIMGNYGSTGFAGVLMGSVAERVIALSMCSVLVVKSNAVH
ncbi:MAG: universal stress protein [Nitrospirae bacterium]|nr:universal stress protein [Nitrospirota bacterium]MBF0536067.1 universal stress protein [Nitrospirota bacterium]MBF0617972.1 universal stress protein [Nitrospirota bacterium]